ncbi:MAG TPA: helix-turn-helix domain-containing protein [bacterium]|nr:helix-turn-helix domain-containing protein [bacterium]
MRRDHAHRQREIVAAATKVISKEGLRALTVKRLAGEIGVTDAAIYRHFKNKEEVLAAVLAEFSAPMREVHATILASDRPNMEKMEMLFTEKCLRLSRRPEHALIMRSIAEFRGDRRLNKRATDMLSAYRDEVLSVIRAAQERGEMKRDTAPEHLYYLIIGGLHALVQQWEASRRSFDLRAEGTNLWRALSGLIRDRQP